MAHNNTRNVSFFNGRGHCWCSTRNIIGYILKRFQLSFGTKCSLTPDNVYHVDIELHLLIFKSLPFPLDDWTSTILEWILFVAFQTYRILHWFKYENDRMHFYKSAFMFLKIHVCSPEILIGWNLYERKIFCILGKEFLTGKCLD